MADREKFQSFLEKKLKLERSREEVLKREIDGMELTFIKNFQLERKAMSIYKVFLNDAKKLEDFDIDIKALFNDNVLDDLSEIIYDSCITLQNDELHRQLEIKNPIKIVEAIFDTTEIYMLGLEVIEFIITKDYKGDDAKK